MSINERSYHRHLPHLRVSGSYYYVTWRLHPSQIMLGDDDKDIVENALKFFNGSRYRLIAYVIMDDHVHVIVSPNNSFALEKIIFSWKSFTSNQIAKQVGRKSPIWQEEYYDHIIRNEADYLEKTGYILTNPQRKWPDIKAYKWVWGEHMTA